MAYYNTASDFYRSIEWRDFRLGLMQEAISKHGEIICAECGKPIIKSYDCIAHHVKEITFDNLNDCNITLNPSNIELLHARCHNLRHARFGFCNFKRVFLVYGCPLAGKSEYVNSIAGKNDIKVDINDIYSCVSFNPQYVKPNSIYDVSHAVHDALLDIIKTRRGKWTNAFIIGGYAFKGERERLCTEYGAEQVFIPCDKETALQRLASTQDGRDIAEYTKHIETWFNRYQE